MNWNGILSSAVVAAIFSGLLSYIISRRQGNLKYITNERKEWREKIREIAIRLYGASYKDTMVILTELKVRINPYGNNGVFNQYIKDAHIWKIINELQSQKPTKKELSEKQNQLIEYLALLLKADWERTKNEVKGNMYDIASWVMFILSNIYFTVSIFSRNSYIQINNYILMTMAGSYVFLIVIVNLSHNFIVKEISGRILNCVVKGENMKYSSKRLLICYVLCTACVIGHVYIYCITVRQAFDIIGNGNSNQLSITLLFILYTFGLGFKCISQKMYIDNEYDYANCINRICSKC